VTLLPRVAATAEARAARLALRPFGPKGPSRTIVLAARRGAANAEALRRVAAAIREAA
jgi:hypothetical protein